MYILHLCMGLTIFDDNDTKSRVVVTWHGVEKNCHILNSMLNKSDDWHIIISSILTTFCRNIKIYMLVYYIAHVSQS